MKIQVEILVFRNVGKKTRKKWGDIITCVILRTHTFKVILPQPAEEAKALHPVNPIPTHSQCNKIKPGSVHKSR